MGDNLVTLDFLFILSNSQDPVPLSIVPQAISFCFFCYVGCIKFLESYYLILVTKRCQIGCICGHPIYCIDESQMITIPHSFVQTDVATSKNELR